MTYTVVASLVYNVWRARNEDVWRLQVPSMQKVLANIKHDVKNKIANFIGKKVSQLDREWFHSL